MASKMLATHRIPGLVLVDWEFEAPLDYQAPGGEQITLFAREARAPGEAAERRPWLVFFQGGPGFAAPRPTGATGWLKRAVQDFRVLLLDERGTGRSTQVSTEGLLRIGGPEAQAAYLQHFRADSIVQDAELIRRELVGEDGKWTALGQSFGGFCVTHYLSVAPEGLEGALLTGGLPPLTAGVDDIYRATYRRVLGKNEQFYARYPDDAERAKRMWTYLGGHEVRLPAGGKLTRRRFQQLGIAFGSSTGFEEIHYLLEGAFAGKAADEGPSYSFLREFENRSSFETNPIYALLHEAEYCQGTASRWSAERVRGEFAEFDADAGDRVYFTGEMVYPWMFEEYAHLRPLREAAEILAEYEAWPRLYDTAWLQRNTVPCAAAVYYDDMYVERAFSEETAQQIRGLRVWVTNEHEHNGLRADGERVLDRLLGMMRGEI